MRPTKVVGNKWFENTAEMNNTQMKSKLMVKITGRAKTPTKSMLSPVLSLHGQKQQYSVQQHIELIAAENSPELVQFASISQISPNFQKSLIPCFASITTRRDAASIYRMSIDILLTPIMSSIRDRGNWISGKAIGLLGAGRSKSFLLQFRLNSSQKKANDLGIRDH